MTRRESAALPASLPLTAEPDLKRTEEAVLPHRGFNLVFGTLRHGGGKEIRSRSGDRHSLRIAATICDIVAERALAGLYLAEHEHDETVGKSLAERGIAVVLLNAVEPVLQYVREHAVKIGQEARERVRGARIVSPMPSSST